MPRKQPKGTKRIIDLDVSEFSPVDKPAIDEEFIIIKSLKGEAPMKITKKIIEKATNWQASKTKSSEKKGEICVFCKQEGGSEPKIGLKCSVCFSCAVQREDKGVFDQCLEGSFDIEEYKTKYPDEFKTKSSGEDETNGKKNGDDPGSSEDPPENEDDEQEDGEEDDSDSSEDVTDEEKGLTPRDDLSRDELRASLEERSKKFGIEIRDDAALTFPAGFPSVLDEYGDPVNLKYPFDSKKRAANARVRFKQNASEYEEKKSKAIVHERIVRAELEFDIDPSFDEKDPLDQLLPEDLKEQLQKIIKGEKPSVVKRLSKVEKQFEELKGLLEQSLALHDEAARSLNQIVEMQMMALEQVLMLTGGQDEQNDGQDGDVTAASRHSDILGEIKTLKAEVSKAGAKISSSRLRVLQEISEKLSDLIRSVMDGGKDGKRKSVSKSTDGLVSRIKTVESSIEAIRNEATNKVEALAKRLDDIENTAGASGALDEDEDPPDGQPSNTQKSIFAPLIGLDEIKMQIDKRDTYLKREKTDQS